MRHWTRWASAALLLSPVGPMPRASADGPPGDATAPGAARPGRPEWVAMLADIVQGSQLGPTDGWFRSAVAQTQLGWDAARSAFDRDGDGRVAPGEFPGSDADFGRLDRDGDGALAEADFDFSDHALVPSPSRTILRLADRDGSGKITREEFAGLFEAISPDDEFLALSDLEDAITAPTRRGRGSSGGPEGPSKATLIKGLFTQEIGSLQPGPDVGEAAPDFTLRAVDTGASVSLSGLIGPKPVVLVFGNVTCGPFRSQAGDVQRLYDRYKDRATIVMVYVREAHPTDGWSMESNDAVGVSLPQPRTDAERLDVARTCRGRLDLDVPMLVDTIDDAVGSAYSGMPSRLYLIGRDGRVAYKSGRGPFGFKPRELEQSLLVLLNQEATVSDVAFVPLPSDEETWAKFPPAERGDGQPLPNWAKAVAVRLPRTAAAMLELDLAQRTRSPLDPALRAKMRWVVAHANRCAYSEAYALADLRRAGADAEAIEALVGGPDSWPEADREPLEFARLLTVDAPSIPDTLFARLVGRFGRKQAAAMVLLAAYGNFQDRLVLGLGLPMEAGGPLPPLDVAFSPGSFQANPILPDPAESGGSPAGRTVVPEDPEWSDLSFEQLQARLEVQRDREPRLPIPTWEEVRAGLPEGYPARPTKIVWNLVGFGYVPELAIPWSVCTRTMWAEGGQDRVLEESLFWVQTRAVRCNYCMGHCEMLLEVAGLDDRAVADRTRLLAGDDWSSFPEAEQRAFALARTLSKTPWELTRADYEALVEDFGPDRAMPLFWWLCRGLYMTRVSDGFQLPLERENVFAQFFQPPAASPAGVTAPK